MAKIGVYTFSNTKDNYGQVLQYLATQEYLNSRGHNTCLIIPLDEKISLHKRFLYKLTSVINRIYSLVIKHKSKQIKQQTIYQYWSEVTDRLEKQYPRYFDKFRNDNFHVMHIRLSELSNGCLDAVAVGSDQTWSWSSKYGFCAFPKKNIKKFALAPSLGQHVFSDEAKKWLSHWIHDFDFITCREQSGIDLCTSLGKESVLLLDPTFLLTKEDYSKYAESFSLPSRNFILLYLLGAEVNVAIDEVYKLARMHDLDIIYIASQGRDDDFSKLYATVPQWLYAVEKSSYVVTNSFHGMAFSIIYQKLFLTLPLSGETKNMNERMESLASQLNLEDRIYQGSLEKLFDPIDYTKSTDRIFSNRDMLSRLLNQINL